MKNNNLMNPDNIDEAWSCLPCTQQERSDYVPFVSLSSQQLSNMNSVDSMNMCQLLPDDEVINQAMNINRLEVNDIDETTIEKINCKYYSCDEFFNLNNSKSFDITHSNVNGFVSHADDIQEFITQTKKVPNVVCISETSLQNDEVIPPNALLTGYLSPFTTNTESEKGGVAIFVRSNEAVVERNDLKIGTKEFEGVWIEIKKQGAKNIVVGCLYRHPHYNNFDDKIPK